MRDWIFERLSNDQAVRLSVNGRVFSSGSVGQRNVNETKPFIVYRAGVEQKFHRESRTTRQQWYVYAHIEPGSAVTLDKMMGEIQTALLIPTPVKMPDGRVLIDIEWISDSDDLFDDGFNTTTRYGTYTITARK